MMRVRPVFEKFKSDKMYYKNKLYKIEESCQIPVCEVHENGKKETVVLEYILNGQQYGVFGHEFRSPVISKRGCKTTDILACVVDDQEELVKSIILDIKSNISGFSDDLLKEGAMMTVIKEVRDFIDQIHQEILHKNSFMIYYKDDGYSETEFIGIATKSFEPEKFRAAARYLESMRNRQNSEVMTMPEIKLKPLLYPYIQEAGKLRDFSDKKVNISGKYYDLNIFILSQAQENEWSVTLPIAL